MAHSGSCSIIDTGGLESLQTQFSLLFLEPLETGWTAVTNEKKMNLLYWSPLHKALLTGNVEVPHSDWQKQREAEVVAQLLPSAECYGVTLGQLALAWLLKVPGGTIPIVGTINVAHIEEAAAVDIVLERDDWYEMMVIARGPPMPWANRSIYISKSDDKSTFQIREKR